MKTMIYQPKAGTTKGSIECMFFAHAAQMTSLTLFKEYYCISHEEAEVMYQRQWNQFEADFGSDILAVDFVFDETMNEIVGVIWTSADKYVLAFPNGYLVKED